jgi:hypothetical protein
VLLLHTYCTLLQYFVVIETKYSSSSCIMTMMENETNFWNVHKTSSYYTGIYLSSVNISVIHREINSLINILFCRGWQLGLKLHQLQIPLKKKEGVTSEWHAMCLILSSIEIERSIHWSTYYSVEGNSYC